MQDGRPISFASRTLTAAEKNYSQIEKECLAVLYSCKKFNDYLYGQKFELFSDHKPLEIITRKNINSAPKRLQRMLVSLQDYDFNLIWQPGIKMHISDYLSRNPQMNKIETEELFQEIEQIN